MATLREIDHAVMIRPRTFVSCVVKCVVLALAAATSVSTGVQAGDYVVVGAVNRIADRCAARFGEGFVDGGNGVCTRVGIHPRVYIAPRNAGMNAWSSGAASNAAVIHTDGSSMVPGAPAQHLRVRGNLDSYSPFR